MSKTLKSGGSLPTVSIIIPTLNSSRTLGDCLKSILSQDYPLDKTEVIVADGGSTDATISLVENLKLPMKYQILQNPLKTGEAGKAVGVKQAKNEIIAFIDSDNILPYPDWLRGMVEPFEDPILIACEPLEYTYRREDTYITRYSALLGMNDPLCLFLGNYDRYCKLTGRWTGMPVLEEDKGKYIEVTLNGNETPTIGANGFLIRRAALDMAKISDYFFDIDILHEIATERPIKVAKVKTSIVHIFSGSVKTFARKQKRRIMDFTYYKKLNIRKYPWNKVNKRGLLKFIFYNLLFLPLVGQSIKGYLKQPDLAWFFHPLACEITLWEYSWGKIVSFFGSNELSRNKWSQ